MTIPNLTVRPEQLRGHETDFGTSISSSLWLKIVNNHAWVEKSLPIGMILFFYESTTEADGTPKPAPNPDIWIPCQGQTINDPESPLDGQTLPDLRDRFLKGSQNAGQFGGQTDVDISHSHGGQLVPVDDRSPGNETDSGTGALTGSLHTHSLSTEWSNQETVIPKNVALQAYMRFK